MRRRAAALAAVLGAGACLVASGQAAATAPLDAQQRVSQMGPDGDLLRGRPSLGGLQPARRPVPGGVVRERRRRGA